MVVTQAELFILIRNGVDVPRGGRVEEETLQRQKPKILLPFGGRDRISSCQ